MTTGQSKIDVVGDFWKYIELLYLTHKPDFSRTGHYFWSTGQLPKVNFRTTVVTTYQYSDISNLFQVIPPKSLISFIKEINLYHQF